MSIIKDAKDLVGTAGDATKKMFDAAGGATETIILANTKKKKLKAETVCKYIDSGINVINSVTNLITTISSERRETEKLRLEGQKVRAEINNLISERENETARMLKAYEIELRTIDKDIRSIEASTATALKTIEEKMHDKQLQHDKFMRTLDIFEKMLDIAMSQYVFYRGENFSGSQFLIPINLLETMNVTIAKFSSDIVKLNSSIVQLSQKSGDDVE